MKKQPNPFYCVVAFLIVGFLLVAHGLGIILFTGAITGLPVRLVLAGGFTLALTILFVLGFGIWQEVTARKPNSP